MCYLVSKIIMMYRKRLNEIKLLDNLSATGESVAYPIADYEQMMLTLASANNGEFTIKVVWSFMDEKPDFSQSSDENNRWSFISVRDLEDGTNIDGTTWISLSGTDAVNSYLVNTPGLKWIWVKLTSYTGGNCNVWLNGFTS